jgi:hypothetical protein
MSELERVKNYVDNEFCLKKQKFLKTKIFPKRNLLKTIKFLKKLQNSFNLPFYSPSEEIKCKLLCLRPPNPSVPGLLGNPPPNRALSDFQGHYSLSA